MENKFFLKVADDYIDNLIENGMGNEEGFALIATQILLFAQSLEDKMGENNDLLL